MKKLFEKLAKNLFDEIKHLSLQLEYFYDEYEIFKYFSFPKDDAEMDERKFKKQETNFEKLYELHQRSDTVVNLCNELNQYIEILQDKINNFLGEFKQKREKFSIELNNLLIEMKETEKYLHEEKFTKIYEKENYDDYIVEISKDVEEIEKELKKKESLRKQQEEILREGEIKEKKRWRKIQKNERNDEEYKKENDFKRKSNMVNKILNEKEIEMFEQQFGRRCLEIIFDSNKHDWSSQNSMFSNMMKDKSHFVILMETVNGGRFGCYIENKIDEFGKYISDGNAFIFKYKRNNLKIYHIKDNQNAIKIHEKQGFWNYTLFEIGVGDIVIKTTEKRQKCSCKQQTFIYNKENELLGGKNNLFEVEQFVVIQMEKTLFNERRNNFEQNKVFINEDEMKTIEKWSDMIFQDVIFDSEHNNWSLETSEFDDIILDKNNVIFLFEDTNGNLFGGFIGSKINSIRSDEKGKIIGNIIGDINSFVFSLRSNGRLKEPEKFMIKPENNHYAFQLRNKKCKDLFTIGFNDIRIMKKDFKNECYCEQFDFDYNGKENVLIGNEGNNYFELQRFQVFQMKLNEKQNENEERINFYQEIKKLTERTPLVFEERKEEIKQLETLTEMTYEELVFDTDICDWDKNTTKIDKHLLGREKLVFLIESTNNKLFGGFINEKIDVFCEEGMIKGKPIVDENSFIFSLKSDENMFKPKRYNTNHMFKLFSPNKELMFEFGNSGIAAFKKYMNKICFFKPNPYIKENECVNLFGKKKDDYFTIKRVEIWQMKKTDKLTKRLNRVKEDKYKKESFELEKLSAQIHRMRINKNEKYKKFLDQFNQIEKLCELEFDEIIFDSEICDWSVGTSTFDQRIFGKNNLIFFIEDTIGNEFGGFIKNTINSIFNNTKDNFDEKSITDDNSFVFSLKSNGRLNYPTKFLINQENVGSAFQLFKPNENILFAIGGNDICIMKDQIKSSSYCIQRSFEYHGIENVLIGKESDDDNISVKRIQVWQMMESEKIKKEKAEKAKMIQQVFKNENENLKEWGKELNKIYDDKIQLFEEWTGLKCDCLLFDSECCDWKLNTSTFSDHLFNQENVIILIEDSEGNEFGGYFKTKIDTLTYRENGGKHGFQNYDENAFVFTIKSDGGLEQKEKFMIQQKDAKWSFQLYRSNQKELFSFGIFDINVMKEEFKNECCSIQYLYDYKERQTNLIGK